MDIISLAKAASAEKLAKEVEIQVGNLTGLTTAAPATEAVILASTMAAGTLVVSNDTGHTFLSDGTGWTDLGAVNIEGPQGLVGPQGPVGGAVDTVVKTNTVGLVDTYTITYADATTSTFEVTNGINGTDGTNGVIHHNTRTSGTGASGTTDTYTSYADAGETQSIGTFDVYNGANGAGTVASIVAGTNVTIDATDAANPIVNVEAVGSEHYDQEAEPVAGSTGATWYKPSTGVLYKYINDGTSDVWLDISTAGAGVSQTYVDEADVLKADIADVYTKVESDFNYEPKDSTILKDAAIGVTVLAPNGDGSLLTALTKTQVGLSNVDNTSDATKNSATATLTNKTIENLVVSKMVKEQVSVSTLTLGATSSVQTYTAIADFTIVDDLEDGESVTFIVTNAGFTMTFPTITWWNAEPTLGTTDKIFFEKIGTTLYGCQIGTVA